MAGLEVTRPMLDQKAAEAVLSLRHVYEKIQTMNAFLNNIHADDPDGDLMTKSQEDGGFGYTADEAYLIRTLFQGLDGLAVQPLLAQGSALTGLQ